MKRDRQQVKRDLSHVYWIGGSGCSGKSTIADMMVKDFGFTVYHCDEHWDDHFSRAKPESQPLACTIRDMDWEDLFLLPPVEFAKLTSGFWEEDFEMIIDDLYALPKEKLVVEGVSIDPKFVQDVADPQRVIIMIAFEEFQRAHYLKRDFAKSWFQEFNDPKRVFDNLMKSNALLAKSVENRARELGFKVIIIDEKSTISNNMNIVKKHFKL